MISCFTIITRYHNYINSKYLHIITSVKYRGFRYKCRAKRKLTDEFRKFHVEFALYGTVKFRN